MDLYVFVVLVGRNFESVICKLKPRNIEKSPENPFLVKQKTYGFPAVVQELRFFPLKFPKS